MRFKKLMTFLNKKPSMDRFETCKIIIKAIKLNDENKFQKLVK